MNYTAGHIVESLKKYYDTIKSLDTTVSGDNINNFMKISKKALNLTKDYTILSNYKIYQENKEIQIKLKKSMDNLNEFLKR